MIGTCLVARVVGGIALAGALLAGCSDAEERPACDATEKQACVADARCAWGTGRAGTGCFWVGEVKPLSRSSCATPAPVERAVEGAVPDTWIVMLESPLADLDAETDALASRHDLHVTSRLWIARAFVASMPEETLAALRCEPSVARLTQDRHAQVLAR